ncbi:MAG: hypothetical protein NT175_06920 [Bacteroidetes bacterium]|nr:hypothetical protein [Bacteroidota bacterium]
MNGTEKEYIFVFDKTKQENGKEVTEFKMVEVKTGLSDGGYAEVMIPEGLDVRNLKVVISGAYSLLAAKNNAGAMSC